MSRAIILRTLRKLRKVEVDGTSPNVSSHTCLSDWRNLDSADCSSLLCARDSRGVSGSVASILKRQLARCFLTLTGDSCDVTKINRSQSGSRGRLQGMEDAEVE